LVKTGVFDNKPQISQITELKRLSPKFQEIWQFAKLIETF
jgi:hypothetical protein